MSERRLSNKQVVALIILAAVTGYVLGRLSTNLNIAFAPSAPHVDSSEYVRADPGPESEDSPIVPTAGAPFLGPASAPVTIVEFSDFQCPYCSRATPILHELLEQNDDDLKIVFRNLPLGMHADAGPAAHAALAAHAQGQFWSYHDQLFANQRALDAQSLRSYAEDIDLDMDAFGASLEDELLAQQVASDAGLARRLGINGTPSFLVNGIPVTGAQPAAEFQRIIDTELEAFHKYAEALPHNCDDPQRVQQQQRRQQRRRRRRPQPQPQQQ